MKFKTDYVTNSSCASFVIETKKLTGLQIFMIKNHLKISREFLGLKTKKDFYDEDCEDSSGWNIEESDGEIRGDTSMDNFDMLWFLKEIGIDGDDIKYEGCY